MGLRPFIQWGFLVFLIAIFVFFEAIHLQVLRYNLFLLLVLGCTFLGILCLWILERRSVPPNGEGGR